MAKRAPMFASGTIRYVCERCWNVPQQNAFSDNTSTPSGRVKALSEIGHRSASLVTRYTSSTTLLGARQFSSAVAALGSKLAAKIRDTLSYNITAATNTDKNGTVVIQDIYTVLSKIGSQLHFCYNLYNYDLLIHW